jgi:glycosyltransferase involved in cell wall biosynthesis
MKIRFVTGSAEPGKDGIGDYTLRLAAECAARGHESEVIACNDRYISSVVSKDRMLRLPMSLRSEARQEAFYEWADNRQPPDWASLQFAPYSLQKKGFVFGWADRLRGYAAAPRLQMMIHEFWLTPGPGDPRHHALLGAAQRIFIKALIRELDPQPIHTSNAGYAAILARAGIRAETLPLFGNIPVDPDTDGQAQADLLARLGIASRDSAWFAGIFGTLHPVWPPEPLLGKLIAEARAQGKQLCLVSLGRMGCGRDLWQRLQRDYAADIRFLEVGEQPPRELSHFLQQLDFGLATTPYEILGKSGTFAAMREHGLPVVVNRFEGPEPTTLPGGIITPSTLANLAAACRASAATAGAAPVVEQFLASLAA